MLPAVSASLICPLPQGLEEKEKQDEMMGGTGKPTKGKGGKLKVKKLQEVMPSPHGRRVIPRVTEEMKAGAEKKLKRKIKVK